MSRTGAEIVGVTRRKDNSRYASTRRPDRFQGWITNPPGTLPRLRTKMFDTQEEAIAWRNAQALPQAQALRAAQPPYSTGEIWSWIPGQEGKYQVSTHGRVWSQPRVQSKQGGILTGTIDKGYRRVSFGPRGSNPIAVHKLVLTTFDRPKPKGLVARHLDGDQLNNYSTNLRWGTHRENALDRIWHNECRRNNYPKERYVRVDEQS